MIPRKYATFDNGCPVHPLHRLRYRQREDVRAAFPNPFATSDRKQSYYHWFEANDQASKMIRNGRRRAGLRGLASSLIAPLNSIYLPE